MLRSYADLPLTPRPADPHSQKVLGSNVGPVPVIRVFGTTDKGNAAALYVHGFTPYALFAAPKEFENNPANMERLRDMLNERLKNTIRNSQNYKTFCLGVKFIDDRCGDECLVDGELEECTE